jgi:PAS domain S-box-containing protein
MKSAVTGPAIGKRFGAPQYGEIVVLVFGLASLFWIGLARQRMIVDVVGPGLLLVLLAWSLHRQKRERRETENLLRQEQEFMRGVLDHLAEGVAACNERGEVIYSNRAYLEMYLVGSAWDGHGSPAEASPLRRVLDGERIIDEIRVVQPGGSDRRELAIGGQVVVGDGGRTIGAVMTVRDVSAHRQAERELRDSESRHRQVVSAMSEGVILRDRNGVVTTFNESAARLLGLAGQDLVQSGGMPAGWTLMREDGRPFADEDYPSRQVLRTGRRQLGIIGRVVAPGGRDWWISMNSEPIMENGNLLPVAAVTTFTDISERKKATEELKKGRHELEESQRLADVGSWRWEVSGDRVEWSRELYRIAGMDPAMGAPPFAGQDRLYTPESWAKLLVLVGRALDTGEPYEIELELIRADGPQVWTVARGEAERDENGLISGLRGTVQDVTAWRQAKNALRKAKEMAEAATRAKSEFLANMSHEIRTPMNGIVGMTSLLLQTEVTGEQRECLETVRASSEALLAILNDVLDFSKIEAGKLEIERVPFDLERMVEDAIDVVAEMASQKGLELQFYVSGELPAVLVGDSLRMRQILLNFLSNAIKFTARGSVTVLVEPVDEERTSGVGVRFSVSDTGLGLSEDQQRQLFQNFVQLDASTTRKHGGTGLGLSISRRLAELMGGAVGVQSLAGQGSTFWFTTVVGVSPRRLPAPLSHEALRGRRLLVAGNQPMGLLLVRQQVESLGMQMVTARNEAEACAAVEQEVPEEMQFAAALVDVDIAGTDAMELARRMRARSTAAVLPVVFLGTVRDQRLMTEAAGLGGTAYLMKPLRKASLTRALCRLIRRADGSFLEAPAKIEQIAADVLLAEDNVTNQRVAMMMLRRFGCRIDVVSNGEDALAAIGRKRYDVVLMDCQMPVMDGWATAAAIRELERGRRRVPIIALTANALAGDRERCLRAGMDDYLTKPLSLLQLHAQLTKWAAMPSMAGAAGEPPAEHGA